jgi:hypothetical protein
LLLPQADSADLLRPAKDGPVGDVQVLRAGLALLAARFVLPGLGPDVDQAIKLACELLACGLSRARPG